MKAASDTGAARKADRRRIAHRLTVAAAILATVSGCVTTGNQPSSTASSNAPQNPCEAANNKYYGAAIGAVAVGTLAYFLGGKKAAPAALGVLGGSAIGYLIGQDIDDRRCEQWKIAQAANVTARFDDVVVPVTNQQGREENVRVGQVSTWEGHGHFEFGSATLTPEAQRYFRAVAETYARHRPINDPNMSPQERQQLEAKRQEQRILLVGHTDDVGSSDANAKLSEARAKAVGEVFRAAGVNANRLFFQGAGETFPIADNRTDDGRAKNRRVEIVDMESEAALAHYLRNRMPKTEFYRVAQAPAGGAPSKPETKVAEKAAPATNSTSKPSTVTAKATATTPPTTTTASPGSTASVQAESQGAGKQADSQAKPRPAEIDFGGVPAIQVAGVSTQMIGGQKQSTTQSVASYLGISSSFANDSVFQSSCLEDRPRIGDDVKRLSDGKEFDYRTKDFLPGLYRSSYAGRVNGHMVGMTDIAVLRDGATPVGKSPILVFKNYSGAAEKDRKPDAQLPTNVNVYPGNDALLYRVFVSQDKAPLQCVDLVFPYQQPFGARYGKVYYEKRGQAYAADFNPSIAR